MKLWDKGYRLDKSVKRFTSGEASLLDKALVKYDCLASIAHAGVLRKAGVLTENEKNKLVRQLRHLLEMDRMGRFRIARTDEYGHTAIERHLIAALGNIGKKIHTARSRNDQVATALRLFCRDKLVGLQCLTDSFARRRKRRSFMSMRNLTAIALTFALSLSLLPAQDFQAQARSLVTDLMARQFDKVIAQFDETMTKGMPAEKLSATLDALVSQVGAFRTITGIRMEQVQGFNIVFVTAQFEKIVLDIRLPYDARGRVAGLFFAPSQPKADWSAADYVKRGSFQEREITVISGKWQLPGTLTLPKGTGPFAAAVLVHGSGPNDQDETLGPNKPFKDLAWGLADRGVAVLRYTKRTRRMAELKEPAPAGFTVRDETVDDAVAAVSSLTKTSEIDGKRIYVLGHSLGGMLAPRIAAGSRDVAGIILLAGSTRPLEQSVLEQLRYLAALGGANGAGAAQQIPAAERAAKEIQNPGLSPTATIELLGTKIPASYFMDLRDYHPAQAAAKLNIPILVLQGEKDYQVTLEDLEGWKSALEGRPGVTIKTYPGLTHLFMPSLKSGSGLGTPEDYLKPAHMAVEVITDIANWILSK